MVKSDKHDNTFNLNRFISAQEEVYDRVLKELKNGEKRCSAVLGVSPMSDTEATASKLLRNFGANAPFKKRSHWMWYIFPQLDGLAQSTTSKYYAIKSREEALAYLNHPVLGSRLNECAKTLLDIEGKTVLQIFGYPDDLKLKSSMTLFSEVATDSVFVRVLDKYFQGEPDSKTTELLKLEKTDE